jgi:hypothetical protein
VPRSGADDEELRNAVKPLPEMHDVSVAKDSEKLPIMAEANAEDSRFAPECAFCPPHRFGDSTGVRAFECALSSLTCSFDHGLRCTVVFFVGTNNLLDARLAEET